MYILDTNTLIYFFKNMGSVADRMFSKSPKDIAISIITLYELGVGIEKSTNPEKRKTQLDTLVSRISVIPFAEKQSKCSAKIRARLESKGEPIGPLDILIAGTALSLNAVLVTHNTKEFERVEELKIEDWF
ncbi:MAG: type II toxin-antitoxin system VapC family toxin [Thermodesulfobacteriota bacterium]